MGQKVSPRGMRLQVNKDWGSLWYAGRNGYKSLLHSDIKIRAYLEDLFKHALIAKVVIKRQSGIVINVHAARIGVIIGKNGIEIEKAKAHIKKISECDDVEINVIEVKRPETCARLIAYNVSQQLEKRVSFRKAMKRAIANCLRYGVKGVKISCSGRLGGGEIARTEWYREGRMPLHTIRANIDYAACEAQMMYGIIGTKVWVFN